MILAISSDQLTVSIDQTGARLRSVQTRDGTECLRQDDPACMPDGYDMLQSVPLEIRCHTTGALIFAGEAADRGGRIPRFCYRLAYALEGGTICAAVDLRNTSGAPIQFAAGAAGKHGEMIRLEPGGIYESRWYLRITENQRMIQR